MPINVSCDVLVVGGGIAASFAAIKAKETSPDLDVVMVDKGYTGKSGCSALAAGLFTLAPDMDDYENWRRQAFQEICENGDYLNDQEWLDIVLGEFHDRLIDMESWGCSFIKTADGKFERILVRGSNPQRVIRAVKFCGPSLMEQVRKKLIQSKIRLMDKIMVTDLLVKDGNTVGAVAMHTTQDELYVFHAKSTVLACGGTYGRGTYFGHKPLVGDAYAMAFRAGVELMNFDIISRNQSAIEFDLAGMGVFQGYGSRFLNALGEEFMPLYDPELGNRALKKTMAIAMAMEVKMGRGPIYLDMTHFSHDVIANIRASLPLGMLILERAGYLRDDRIVEKIEWGAGSPGTIAQGGGVRIDLQARSSMVGLYACGDAAAKMANGTGEIGAGAMVWAATSGARAGKYAALAALATSRTLPDKETVIESCQRVSAPTKRKHGFDPNHVFTRIQEVTCPWNMLSIKRADRLMMGLETLEQIKRDEIPYLSAQDQHQLRLAHEAESLLLTSEMMLRSSLIRQESRSELREDFKETDNINWLKWVLIRPQGQEMKMDTVDIPLARYRLHPKKEKFLHPVWKAAERS